MAWQVVASKLDSLWRCLQRVRDRCPESAEKLSQDLDAQDILSLNLTRAVQVCVDIGAHVLASRAIPAPGTMGETFDLLASEGLLDPSLAKRMKSAVGFRNLAVHNYQVVNWAIVFTLATEHLGDFEAFARSVVGEVEGG